MKNTYSYTFVFLLCFFSFPLYGQLDAVDSILNLSTRSLYANPKEASYYAQKALSKASSIEAPCKKAEALQLYGISAKFLGDFDEAIESFYEAIEVCPSTELSLSASINTQISNVYCRLKDYTKAFEYNDKALATAKSLQDSLAIANCHNNRGIIHYNLNEFSIADQCFKNALQINKRIGHIKGVAANLNNLCLYAGNTDEKLRYIEEAIVINKHLNANWALGENYNNKGKQLFYAGRYPEALEILLESKSLISIMGGKELECDNYEYLSWVYDAMGKSDLAYKALYKLHILSEELQNDQKLRSVERNLSSRKLLENRQEMELREQELKISTLQRNIVLVVIISILLVVLAIYLPSWNRKKKDLQLVRAKLSLEQSERELAEMRIANQRKRLGSIQDELHKLNKEVTTFAMFINSRNDLLSSIQQQIKDGYKLSGSDLNKHLKQMNLFIQQYQSGNKDESLLLKSIEDKNKAYLERLLLKHPDLTQGEKNLATLLRVNLSTKDIALLTGSNPKSVNMSRYRLRKSLGLVTDENLISYLRSI